MTREMTLLMWYLTEFVLPDQKKQICITSDNTLTDMVQLLSDDQ